MLPLRTATQGCGHRNQPAPPRMKRYHFQEVAQPASQEKVCVQACSPALIDVNRDAKVSIEIGVPRGGESNQICSANILAGENSKSIAFRGNKAIKNVLDRLDPDNAPNLCVLPLVIAAA